MSASCVGLIEPEAPVRPRKGADRALGQALGLGTYLADTHPRGRSALTRSANRPPFRAVECLVLEVVVVAGVEYGILGHIGLLCRIEGTRGSGSVHKGSENRALGQAQGLRPTYPTRRPRRAEYKTPELPPTRAVRAVESLVSEVVVVAGVERAIFGHTVLLVERSLERTPP